MNRKKLQCAAWGFAALLIADVSYPSDSATTDEDLVSKYNATLEKAIETLRGGGHNEAYKITAELESLCAKDRTFAKKKGCNQDHLAKIRGDFFYELAYQKASDLGRGGDYLGAIGVMEALEPSCVFLRAEACINEHNWFLNTTQLMAVREDANHLVQMNKFEEASIKLSKAEPFANALSENDQTDYHWELASAFAWHDPDAAVAEVRDMVRGRKLSSMHPLSNYLSYLGWLVSARESEEFSKELVRFFKICHEFGGLIHALEAEESSAYETLARLDLLLVSLRSLDADIEGLAQALLDASSFSGGVVRSLMLRRAGDFVLVKSGKERLAEKLYQESGLTDIESTYRLGLATKGFPSLADNVAEYESETAIETGMDALMEALLSGVVPSVTFNKLYGMWSSLSVAEIENDLVQYAGVAGLLAAGAPEQVLSEQILSRGYLGIADGLDALRQKYRHDKRVVDEAVKLELLKYWVLLDLAEMRAAAFDLDIEQLELSIEQLRVREALYGDQSYQLLEPLSSVARGYHALGDETSFTEIFFRAKSIEAENLSLSGQCNLSPYRFMYPFLYAKHVLSRPELEDWFLSEGAIHLENAKRFIGVEKHYQCLAAVKQLVSEYLFLTDGHGSNLEMIYELSQIADISDLLISTELGLEKLRMEDPDLLESLVDYGRISQGINATGTSSKTDDFLEDFLEYRKQKTAIYERIRLDFPEVASLMVAQGLSISETQNSLADDEALLYYIEIPTIKSGQQAGLSESTQPSYLLFIVKSNDVHVFPLQSKSAQGLTSNLQGLRGSLDQDVNRASELSPFDLDAAKEVFDTLVSPAVEMLDTARRLFIIPSPSLAGIPFELLPTSDELPSVNSFIDFRKYRDVPWMNDRYSISYLSSPRMLGRRRSVADANDSKFLGVGNPEFSPPADSLPPSTNSSEVSRSSDTLQRVLARDYKALSAAGSVASSLPESQFIVDSMARRYGQRATILTGVSATESRLFQLDLSQYSTIAFATHGLLGADIVPEPALVLGHESGESAFDGFLTTREIVQMKLAAELVVLAACNSATTARVDGVASLANSFLTAGSASVVASHWAVDVNATAQLFDAFARHREMTPDTSSADLLQRARMDLLRQNKNQLFAHPAFWGGFATYGF